MSDVVLILLAFGAGIVLGATLMLMIVGSDRRLTHCPKCKYYYPPVCTFYKWLPMVSRKGFCYHARPGKYEGDTPTVEMRMKND